MLQLRPEAASINRCFKKTKNQQLDKETRWRGPRAQNNCREESGLLNWSVYVRKKQGVLLELLHFGGWISQNHQKPKKIKDVTSPCKLTCFRERLLQPHNLMSHQWKKEFWKTKNTPNSEKLPNCIIQHTLPTWSKWNKGSRHSFAAWMFGTHPVLDVVATEPK